MIVVSIVLLLALGFGLQGTSLAEETSVSVEIQTDKTQYQAGDTVHLTVTLSNRGTEDLTDIRLRVPLANLNEKIAFLAGGEEAALEAGFNIPDNFYMGYIGVGAYAEGECKGRTVSKQGKALVAVDEQVSNPGFKECKLPPLPDNWESEISFDRIPVPAGEPQAEPSASLKAIPNVFFAARRDARYAVPGPAALSSYPDTIEVTKSAQSTQGCRAYQVTLGITGTPPEVPVDVILVIDRSGSMAEGNPSAMSYAKTAAEEFAAQVLQKTDNRVAVVSFAYTGVWRWLPPGYIGDLAADTSVDINFSANLNQVTNAINNLKAEGGTNTEAGFVRAKNLLAANGRENVNKAIVFLTDGVPTVSIGRTYGPSEPTNHNNHTIAAYQAGQSCHSQTQVFTVNLLSAVPSQCLWVARDTMQKAQNAGYYETFSAADLSGIYNQISEQLNYSAIDAVVTDKIPDNFELIPGSFQSSPTAPVQYNESTGIITWTAGTIGTSATMSYKIRAKADFAGGDQVPTNEWATLTYTDVNEVPDKTKAFPVPLIDVPAPLTVNAGPDRELSLGGSIDIGDNLVVTGGIMPYSYLWSCAADPGWSSTEPNPRVSPAEETVYTVTVTDKWGCTASDEVTVSIIKGSITVTKVVQAGGSTSKTFPIYLEGNGHTWSMLLADGESATVGGLKPGTYTIREVVLMDYRLVSISPSTVTITPTSLTGNVTVTNRKVNDSWLRDDDEAINTFKVGVWVQ